MKEPDKIGFILLGIVSLSSALSLPNSETLPFTFACDQAYSCPQDNVIPFTLGKQYIYSYNQTALLKITDIILPEVDAAGNKEVTESGLLKVTPTSTCEIEATLQPNDKNDDVSVLKLAVINGELVRVCSSQFNPANFHINSLKTLVTMLFLDTSSNNEIVVEESSQGACLTKYENCSGNNSTLIRYQSSRHCNNENRLAQNIHLKIEDFQNTISSFSEASTSFIGKCEILFSPLENLNIPQGLSVCADERSSEVVSVSKCVESLELGIPSGSLISGKFYNVATLKLEEIKEQTGNSEKVSFFTTSIYQSSPVKRKPRKVLSFGVFQSLLEAVNGEFQSFETFDYNSDKHFIQLKAILESSTDVEDLPKFVTYLQNSSAKTISLALKILASEASNENIFQIIQTLLSDNSLLVQLSEKEVGQVVQTILAKISSAEPSLELLQFGEFMISFTRDSSDANRFYGLMTYSNLFNKFCAQMETLSGERYCLKTNLIESSPVVQMAREASSTAEKLEFVEALSTFQQHGYNNANPCVNLLDAEPLKFWSIFNCLKATPCNKEGKNFLREILQSEHYKSNEKIAGFLAMQRCFDEEDVAAIKTLFQKSAKYDEELLNFIRVYGTNRKLNGIQDDLLISLLPNENSITIFQNETQFGNKRTTASNTLNIFEIDQLPHQLQVETNMLYFDTPANVPQLITVSLSASQKSNIWPILEMEINVNDLRRSDSSMGFAVSVILRKFGTAVYIKEIPISQELILQSLSLIQLYIQNKFIENPPSVDFFTEHMGQLLFNEINIDALDFIPVLRGHSFMPTISGIPYEFAWDIDARARLQIRKNDFSYLFSHEPIHNSGKGHFAIKPEFNINGQIILALGPNLEKGYKLEGNLSAMLPVHLDLERTEGTTEETIKLRLPSLTSAQLIRTQVDFREFDGNDSSSKGNWKLALGATGNGKLDNKVDSMKQMEISARRYSRDGIQVFQLQDINYQATLICNTTADEYYKIKFNFTSNLEDSIVPKNYEVEVGFQNTDNSKKINAAFITPTGQEYSLDAYYLWEQKNLGTNTGFLSCGSQLGTGVLCIWPLCWFCGTEYFLGASVNAPKLGNIKLIDASVTQEFPNKKIELVLKSERVPLVGKVDFKVSIDRGNNTAVISSSRVRNALDQKLRNIYFPSHPGDALPESVSTKEPYSTIAYSVDALFATDLLGQSNLFVSWLFAHPHGYPSRESHLIAGEIMYPSWRKRQQESISANLYFYGPMKFEGQALESTLRSSQLPVVNFDFVGRYQKLAKISADKTVILLRPVNLIRGEIRLELYNYQEPTEQSEARESSSYWDNVYFNQTYRVLLPECFAIRAVKGKAALKTKNGVPHMADLEILVGVEGSLELKYELLPEPKNSINILTSVTTTGETYGLYHHIELDHRNSEQSQQDGSNVGERGTVNKGYKYTGTYALGEESVKATGTFESATGRELLPFSKFNIQMNTVNGKDTGIRLFGSETVQNDRTHNISVGITVGNSSVFDMTSEISPHEEVPFKAKAYWKDHGELKVSDSSKSANKRSLQVKGRWFPNKQIMQGKIAFPTSLAIAPLYFNFDAGIFNEHNLDSALFQVTSASTLNITEFRINSNNVVRVKDAKWQVGLDFESIKKVEVVLDSEEWWRSPLKHQETLSLSTHFIRPDLEKYAFEILRHEYVADSEAIEQHNKYQLKLQRPKVVPFQLLGEILFEKEYKKIIEPEDFSRNLHSREQKVVQQYNRTLNLIACHKDNFFYIFPMLNFDINVQGNWEYKMELEKFADGQLKTSALGKLACLSSGANQVPFCNLLKTEFKLNIANYMDRFKPMLVNLDATNKLESFSDHLKINWIRRHEPVSEVVWGGNEDYSLCDRLWLCEYFSTIQGIQLFRLTGYMDYQLQRKFRSEVEKEEGYPINLQGTSNGTWMFQSWNNFESTDSHKWNSFSGTGFHVWTNEFIHSANLSASAPSEIATFSSHYVSLGEASENSSKNVTWMELRSSLSINGFGTISQLAQNPSLLLSNPQGDFDLDVLAKSEFSPVKAFRVTVSHQQDTSVESEDDNENSAKIDALTKFDVLFNQVELSTINSLTVSTGNWIAVGNSFGGRFGSALGIYEYISLKLFGIVPENLWNSPSNIVHLDASSSWTNVEDDDTDIRMVADVVCPVPLVICGLPLVRFVIVENSTDMDIERNTSFLIYQSVAVEQTPEEDISTKLSMNILSDNLDQLSFTQMSLQSVAQQVSEDYFNSTELSLNWHKSSLEEGQAWHGYNLEIRSRHSILTNTSNSYFSAKWFGFDDKSYHCNALLEKCYDYGNNVTLYKVDQSNYCNLLLFPAKQMLYAVLNKL